MAAKKPVDLAKKRAAKKSAAKRPAAKSASKNGAKQPARRRGGPRAQVSMEEVGNIIEDGKLEALLEEAWAAKKKRRAANTVVREKKQQITVMLADRELEEGEKYRCGRFPIEREDIAEKPVAFVQHARTAFTVGDPVDGS